MEGGMEMSPSVVVAAFLTSFDSETGIAISGGEPLLQAAALLSFLDRVRDARRLSQWKIPVTLFTHYSRAAIDELSEYDVRKIVVGMADEVVYGEYDQDGNRVHEKGGPAEIHVLEDGDLLVTGGEGAALLLSELRKDRGEPN